MNKRWAESIDTYMEDHRQELVDMVIRLVNIPSVKGEPAPQAPCGPGPKNALLEGLKICAEQGMTPYNHENICGSAVYKVPGAKKEIGFVAHLDVVPAGGNWRSDPFVGIERDGFIVGRGARDNKAGFGAALLAINAMRDLHVPLRSSVRLIMGCDEECGMSDMEYFAKNGPVPDFSIVTDCLFPVSHGEKGMLHGDVVMPVKGGRFSFKAGEATNIIPASATATLDAEGVDLAALQTLARQNAPIAVAAENGKITITATGISAHASEPEKARNAILLLAQFLLQTSLAKGEEEKALRFIQQALTAHYGEFFGIQFEDAESGKTTCIGGLLSSKPGEIRLNLNIRYAVTDHHDRFYPLLEKVCRDWGYGFDLHEASASYYIPANRPEVIRLTGIYQEVSGDTRNAYVVAGGTYARKLPNAVAFGPGSKNETFPYPPGHGDAHQPDESQDIAALVMAAKIYALSIIALDEILNG